MGLGSFSSVLAFSSFPFPSIRLLISILQRCPQEHAKINFDQNRYQISPGLNYFQHNLLHHYRHHQDLQNISAPAQPKKDLLTPIFCD